MNNTKIGFRLEIIYWLLLIVLMKLMPAIGHTGIGVLALSLILMAGIFLWVWDFFKSSKGEITTHSIVLFALSLVIRVSISVGAIFSMGKYPGSQHIMLVSTVLLWAYLITSCIKGKPQILSFMILQMVMVICI
ncbi:MAG: hypothetical protein U0L38_03140 [Bacteroidales bacterium]|nr:hypothetical protein [Bacteroidales bacterium]